MSNFSIAVTLAIIVVCAVFYKFVVMVALSLGALAIGVLPVVIVGWIAGVVLFKDK